MEAALLGNGFPQEAALHIYMQIVRLHLTVEERQAALEGALGAKLPEGYRSFLSGFRADPDDSCIAATQTGYWEVNTLFEFADGPIHLQIDSAYRTLSDTLPPSMLPIGMNSAGKIYCLVLEGRKKGHVVFIDRQRAHGIQHIKDVAPSFSLFLQGLKY